MAIFPGDAARLAPAAASLPREASPSKLSIADTNGLDDSRQAVAAGLISTGGTPAAVTDGGDEADMRRACSRRSASRQRRRCRSWRGPDESLGVRYPALEVGPTAAAPPGVVGFARRGYNRSIRVVRPGRLSLRGPDRPFGLAHAR